MPKLPLALPEIAQFYFTSFSAFQVFDLQERFSKIVYEFLISNNPLTHLGLLNIMQREYSINVALL
jgi:hypothetical protein